MNWKVKALIQNMVVKIPNKASLYAYHLIMLFLGGYKPYINPIDDFRRSIRISNEIKGQGYEIKNVNILEIGTGKVFNIPAGLSFLGAPRITTFDVDNLIRADILAKMVAYLRENKSEILELFRDYEVSDKLEEMLNLKFHDVAEFCRALNIFYINNLKCLADGSIDVCYSMSTLEHIPEEDIKKLLTEIKRVMKTNGLLINHVVLADHNANYNENPSIDKSISTVNFLKYSDNDWNKISGNKFNFHNRLRASEYNKIFDTLNIECFKFERTMDEKAAAVLRAGFALDNKFKDKNIYDLSIAEIFMSGKFR